MTTQVGIDEVGRGSWAGPLTVAALVAPAELPSWWQELDDSKRLGRARREHLYGLLVAADLPLAVVHEMPDSIDRLGLTATMREAVRRALDILREDYVLAGPLDVVVDGLDGYGVGRPLPKADQLVRVVAGASIVAKVRRDALMRGLAREYPGYGFERHVGYGTAEHRAALARLGPCVLHRRSFRPVAGLCGGTS